MQQLMNQIDGDSLKALDELSNRLEQLREKRGRSRDDLAEENEIIKTVEPILNQQ